MVPRVVGSSPTGHPTMVKDSYKDYTRDELVKEMADIEHECVQYSIGPHFDIAVFTRLFKKQYEMLQAWFDKDGVLQIGFSRHNPTGKPYNTTVEIGTLKEDCEANDIFLCRFMYARILLIFEDTLVVMNSDTDPTENREIGRLESILTAKSPEYVRERLGFLTAGNPNYKKMCGLALSGTYGIGVRFNAITEDYTVDIQKNYNDDLPYDTIVDELSESSQGLFLFYGPPGCGKTTLIKHLLTVIDKPFIFADPAIIKSTTDSNLIDFLDSNKDAVIILEDCERLVRTRDANGNGGSLGALLNLTDGVVGGLMKVKFICTFNCPLDEIDEALTRKGRLKVKYEFKKLSLEKTREILPEANEPMSLADIYNSTKTNDFSKKEKRSIGFSTTRVFQDLYDKAKSVRPEAEY